MFDSRAVSITRVSVVIPLYNKELYINRALASVFMQTHHDFEIIVVNDGSTDAGPDRVRQIQDPRIRLVDQENAGVSAARNRGIREAKSELIAFLDADDEWLPEFLHTVVGLAKRYPEAGAYAAGYLLLKDGERVYRKIAVRGRPEEYGCYFDLIRRGGGIVTSSSIMVKRTVFKEVGVFREGFKLGEDLDMWFRIGLHYKYACSARICALYHYYEPDNASRVTEASGVNPLYMSLHELKDDAGIDPVVKQKAMVYLTRQLANDIEHLSLRGSRDVARRRLCMYKKEFGVNPAYIRLRALTAVPSAALAAITAIRLAIVCYALKAGCFMRHLFVSGYPYEHLKEEHVT